MASFSIKKMTDSVKTEVQQGTSPPAARTCMERVFKSLCPSSVKSALIQATVLVAVTYFLSPTACNTDYANETTYCNEIYPSIQETINSIGVAAKNALDDFLIASGFKEKEVEPGWFDSISLFG
ncbi:MAG: hypothetical protein S4CHLAM7_03810 [Chlamydiae bacterium]|nr:hypothetical protein [Chlamydiota bacterium]